MIDAIKQKVRKDKVICAYFGVDSSVTALLINKAIKKFNLYYGRYRFNEKNEFEYTYRMFKKKYKLNLKLINSSRLFLQKLKNISDPEKRK